MPRPRLETGGIATFNSVNAQSTIGSPSSTPEGSFYSPEGSLYPPQFVFYPSSNPKFSVGGRNALIVKMNGTAGMGKATTVEELKALILACDVGTGDVARHIQEAQFTPRHNAFTSLLQLASKSRQSEKAVEVFEAMQSIAGISPNTFSYSALISALGRVGDWQLAERYFNELLERSKTDPQLRPNTVTYAAMISGT